MITPKTLDFLKTLADNNEKPWFEANKALYLQSKENIEHFTQKLQQMMMEHDVIEKFHLYRIYRDVRFSKDKTPYKTFFSGYYSRVGAERRGSYWLKIEPNNQTMVGGGFYGPNKEDLFRIRKEFEQDEQGILNIVHNPIFIDTFGTLQGEAVKTAPKGFSKEHSNIDFIRMKQFYAFRTFSDEEVLSADFIMRANLVFQRIRPFFDYMSSILTTDLNGEPLV